MKNALKKLIRISSLHIKHLERELKLNKDSYTMFFCNMKSAQLALC